MTKQVFLMTIAILLVFSACNTTENETTESVKMTEQEMIKRGLYLTTIGACHDCHSPKVMTPEGPMPDPDRILSGHPSDQKLPNLTQINENWVMFDAMNFTAFVGPWGISYAANLTPDDTGTGAWSFEQFKTAIRKGKYKGLEGSRDLLPPMPWQMYRNFTDEDLEAIFVYLQSIKPVRNLVPSPVNPEDAKKLVASASKNQEL